MKLLLTSAGFTNDTIVKALADLVEQPFTKLKLAFIPTAANVEQGDKTWLIDDLNNCKKIGFSQIDIVDISALPKDIWFPRLVESDIIFIGGGDTYHLMNCVEKSGFKDELAQLLETRVYVGLSAGSMIASGWWSNKIDSDYYAEPVSLPEHYPCLGFVDFHIIPHLNSDIFPLARLENMPKIAAVVPETIYALDDNSAVKVNGSKVEVVSEGKWGKFN